MNPFHQPFKVKRKMLGRVKMINRPFKPKMTPWVKITVFLGFFCMVGMLLFGGPVETQKPVLVMPFRVTPSQEAGHQWVGRAVSFYITAGLQLNALPVVPDYHTAAILDMHHTIFPYNLTKATMIRLAREHGINRVVGGEIALEDTEKNASDKSPVQLRSFIIDLSDYSQKYLPVIKGQLKDLYSIKDRLLTVIITDLKAGEPGSDKTDTIVYPQFDLNHRGYEIFIKSLLLKDIPKRIQLLEEAQKVIPGANPVILNLELAKSYFDQGDLDTAGAWLEKIPAGKGKSNPIVTAEKIFLEGLIRYARGNTAGAAEAFSSLLQENRFRFEAHHNLGVISFQGKDYDAAERHFQEALAERKAPATWLNLIHVLLARGAVQPAALELNQALRLFPDRRDLVELFVYFVSQSEDRVMLLTVFQEYIPDLFLPGEGNQEPPPLSLKPESPFTYQPQNPYAGNVDIDGPGQEAADEDIESAIERFQGLLEMNPFEPGYYRSISSLYLQKKDYSQAELHGLALVFLEKSRENYLHLMNIYKSSRNKKKTRELRKKLQELPPT